MIVSQPKLPKNVSKPFEQYENKSGSIKLAMTKKYKFETLRTIYKNLNGTFNELTWTWISRAVFKIVNNDKEKYESLLAIMGTSARTSIAKYEMGNMSAGQILHLTPLNDFKDNFKQIQKSLNLFKDKTKLQSGIIIFQVLMKYFISESFIKSFGEKQFKDISFLYTNVQGPNKSVQFTVDEKNVTVEDIIAFVPRGNLPLSIVGFSYDGYVRFGFNADKQSGLDILKLSHALEEEIEESINNIFK